MTGPERQILHDVISGLAVLRLKSEYTREMVQELPPDVSHLLQLVIETSQELQQSIAPLLEKSTADGEDLL